MRNHNLKQKIIVLGPLPPPYMGPSVATEIILNSELKKYFDIYSLNTNTHDTLMTLSVATPKRLLKNLIIYFRLIALMFQKNPDVILIPISQTTIGFLKDSVFIIISRLLSRNILLQLRGSNFANWLNSCSWITKLYVRVILGQSKGVIVLGGKIRHIFHDYFKDDRIFVVPNGADYQIPFLNRKDNSSCFRILYLSNLQTSKGIEDVLHALRYLKEQYPDLSFETDIVGSWLDDFTSNQCSDIVKTGRLPVTFHPPADRSHKFKYFLNADAFVFPPREPEGHPWVIVEAMAAGLPIISTDQGAITDSVIDGVNGFIVEKQNPRQIAEKIRFLLQNPEIRIKMGQESRRLYLENFTEEKMVERLVYAFHRVLEQ